MSRSTPEDRQRAATERPKGPAGMIAEDPTKGSDGWSHTGSLLADTPYWVSLTVASADNRTISGIRPVCGTFLITHGRFPCDLCERTAHHAISPPTTSLLRQVIDLRPVHCRFPTLAARSPLRRAGTLAVSQLRVLNSRPSILACLHFQPLRGGNPEYHSYTYNP